MNQRPPGAEAVPPIEAVADRHDALFVDLDGVVYRGDQVVPAAPATLDRIRAKKIKLLFLTNNSARTPHEVATRLNGLGVHAAAEEVMTSALATAAMLRGEGAIGQRAFVIGERGIREALESAGIELVDGEPAKADLVVVGWDRSVGYAKLKTACLLVERGARLITTNPDASYPAQDGLWPGAGAILSVITTTTGATPTVVGKPQRPMFEAAAQATKATRPLVVGDRLDTDIGGAAAMNWDSLLVLTGASTPASLSEAPHLPTYVADDISGVLDARPPARFRRATPQDERAIRSLLQDAGLVVAGVEARIDQTVVSSERPNAGEIDATASLRTEAGVGLLRSVAVRKSQRGRGLGMLAVAAAIARARAEGTREVYLFTETAASFFDRMGFRTVDRRQLPEPVLSSAQAAQECPASATAMLRELRPDA